MGQATSGQPPSLPWDSSVHTVFMFIQCCGDSSVESDQLLDEQELACE